MARFTVWVLAYGGALWLEDRFTRSTGGAPFLLWILFWAAASVAGLYYLGRLLVFVRQRLLWRLRRRLIVAYLFIAFVPVALIVLLAALGEFIINNQLAAYLVSMKLREHYDELEQLNRAVCHGAEQARLPNADALLNQMQQIYMNGLAQHAASYPGLEVSLHLASKDRAFRLDGRPIKKTIGIPTWLKREEFSGIVLDDGKVALRAVHRGLTPLGELVAVLSLPVTPELLDQVGEGIGPVGVAVTRPQRPGASPSGEVQIDSPGGPYVVSETVNSKRVQVPEPLNRFDVRVYGASSLDLTRWNGENEGKPREPAFVYVTSRIVTLNAGLLATLGDYSMIYVFLFELVAVVFLVIEGVALIIGVRLTRSITQTVDRLYDATERVKAGDFSHRIGVPSRDQLSALGQAFDSMTASVERLLRESQEKSRLESELEIARQVQAQLFPRAAPEVAGLRLYGICKAARSVSGDYYDFLELGKDRIALVLGDVSGKGISAALLMAAMQSALRAQLYEGALPNGVAGEKALSTASVVERLNRQIYDNTPEEKYVTFFFAQYEARGRRLTYTNAGHLAPVLFRNGRIERLRAGGTVVGLFSTLTYEEAEIRLEPGDLLLAFTDGITEPENSYGEEFGEARVLEVARRTLHSSPELLAEEIYRSISDWTGSPELQDDMTLLVAKAIE